MAIAAIRVDTDHVEPSELAWRQGLLAGLHHLRADRVLLHSLIGVGIAVCVFGFSESAFFAVNDAFGKPASFVGVLVTVQGAGAIVSGLAASRLIKRIGEVRALVAGLAAITVATFIVLIAPSILVVCVAMFCFGLGIPVLMVALMTLMQVRTPQRLMGRVSAAFDVVLGTPQAMSIAVGALLVALVDYHVLFAGMTIMELLAIAYLWLALVRRRTNDPAMTPVVQD